METDRTNIWLELLIKSLIFFQIMLLILSYPCELKQ